MASRPGTRGVRVRGAASTFERGGVRYGDVFRDRDPRMDGRTLRVYDLSRRSGTYAWCISGHRRTRIAISRLTNPRLFERIARA